MPRTRCKEVYLFDELSEKAKDRARDWWREGALDYDWWESTYEDAERAGLRIEEFDLDRNRHVKGELLVSAEASIKAILKEHGKDCDTYKMAMQFKARLAILKLSGIESENYEQELERFTEEYTQALCEEYASILQAEYEDQLADEQVDEAIRINEYEFTEEGRRA